MISDRWLLDTNAAVALLNRSPEIAARIREARKLSLPLTVLGELEFGARNSVHREKNLDAIERLLKETTFLLPDRETARHYGEIALSLRRKGRPIPQNDMWIGAVAIQHGLPLLTRDAHFGEIDGLTLLDW